jgi:hypothetical protein
MKGTGTVQFDQNDWYQGMPSGVPQDAEARIRFGGGQRLKPVSVSLAMAASLKRSPDTNHSFHATLLPRNGVQFT